MWTPRRLIEGACAQRPASQAGAARRTGEAVHWLMAQRMGLGEAVRLAELTQPAAHRYSCPEAPLVEHLAAMEATAAAVQALADSLGLGPSSGWDLEYSAAIDLRGQPCAWYGSDVAVRARVDVGAYALTGEMFVVDWKTSAPGAYNHAPQLSVAAAVYAAHKLHKGAVHVYVAYPLRGEVAKAGSWSAPRLLGAVLDRLQVARPRDDEGLHVGAWCAQCNLRPTCRAHRSEEHDGGDNLPTDGHLAADGRGEMV